MVVDSNEGEPGNTNEDTTANDATDATDDVLDCCAKCLRKSATGKTHRVRPIANTSDSTMTPPESDHTKSVNTIQEISPKSSSCVAKLRANTPVPVLFGLHLGLRLMAVPVALGCDQVCAVTSFFVPSVYLDVFLTFFHWFCDADAMST